MSWQIQEAKARFSEMLEKALSEGPQTITRHGKDVAVVIPIDKYRELASSRESLWEYSRRFAGSGDDLIIERQKDAPRKVGL